MAPFFQGQKARSRVVGETLRLALLGECGLGALDPGFSSIAHEENSAPNTFTLCTWCIWDATSGLLSTRYPALLSLGLLQTPLVEVFEQ